MIKSKGIAECVEKEASIYEKIFMAKSKSLLPQVDERKNYSAYGSEWVAYFLL